MKSDDSDRNRKPTLPRPRNRWPAFFAVSLLYGLLVGCGGDGGSTESANAAAQQALPTTVTVSGPSDAVQPGTAIQVTATVSNDSGNGGVTWSLTCPTAPCGSVSPTSTASAVATTYTAPAARPPVDLVVTITATSVDDSSAKGTASVTVAGGMAVTIASTSDNWQQVLPGTTKSYIATVDNDTANAGVSWTLSCATPPCGTVSPSNTASGVATTYTPPQLQNGVQLDVQLTATAVSNPAISGGLPLIAYGRFILLDLAPENGTNADTIGAGTSVQISAEVYSDPANQEAAWTLQCPAADCGSLSASTSESKAPITYTAPPSPVPADLNVTVTASSVSHPDVQATATITVAAVIVSVVPDSALMPLNATQQFTGSLQWALTDGIPWELTLNGTACGSGCGKLSAAKTMSNEAIVYTAPSSVPATKTVSLVASSAADPSKSAVANIQLTTGTVELVPNSLRLNRRQFTSEGKRKCTDPPQTATLTNTGTSALTISGIALGGTNRTAFSQTNSCKSTLGAGQSCEISVKFLCSTSNSATAIILIADSSTDSPQQLNLTGYTTGATVSAAMRKSLALQSTAATPVPTGAQVVGTRVASLSDAKYLDPDAADGSARELMVRFWYPAASSGVCTPAEYTSSEVWSYFGKLLGVTLPRVSTHSCLNAEVSKGAHPVVVLTHGFTGTFTDYTYLAEDLASRGYVVASVNHTHEATATELSDGRLEKSVYGSYLSRYTRYDADSIARAVNVRLRDLTFVLDKLTALNQEPNGAFLGRLDPNRLALAGHSLGGLTTLHAAAREPRFKAAIILDGAVAPRPVPAIRQPVLALLAGHGKADPDECRMWTALQTPLLAIRFPEVQHLEFSDAVWLAGTAVTGGDDSATRVVSDVRRSVAAFLDAAFQGASTERITGEVKWSSPNALVTSGAKPGCSRR